ncbi:MAG: nitroreductase family protein [Candidatus Hodarchaeales archaeon]|jgi:nitroreductase
MLTNPVIETILDHKSIRQYTDEIPTDEIIETIVQAAQQAPFAYQCYSVLLSREKDRNPFKAPLLFTICVDLHKFELIMKKRNWQKITNDLTLLLFGIEDASYMAQNMVIVGRSLGLGSCFLGRPLTAATKIAEEYKLPKRVFPIVQLAMGYPAENPPCRPRYPLDFAFFESEYPDLDDETVTKAMKQMDEGYLAQEYYRKLSAKISLAKRDENFTYDDYSWTEHISRKIGLWHDSTKKQREQVEKCGFNISQD